MREVFLGDICKIKSSKRIFESEYVSNGVAFIRGQEISDKTIGKDGVSYECYISSERYDELKKSYGVPKIGDILITAVGTIGNLCYVDFDTPFYFKDGNVIWFTDFSDTVDSQYLYYFMQSPYFKKQLENALIGAVQKALTMVMLKDVHFELPPMDIQKAIVKIMNNIDNKINLNNSICSDLESMAKTIYDYWFLQFDFPNEDEKPYKSSGGKMVWNDALKREIPEGWKASPYATFGNLLMGQSPKSDSYNNAGVGYPLINGAAELQKDNVIISKYTSNPTRISGKGDLLFCIRATIGNLQFGQTEYCLGRGVASYSPIDKRYAEYLYFVTNDILEHYNKILTGSIIVGITKDDLSEQAVLAPSKERVFAFSKVTQPMFDKIYELKAENLKLTSLRDFLLPMLMNGQVTFKEEA